MVFFRRLAASAGAGRDRAGRKRDRSFKSSACQCRRGAAALQRSLDWQEKRACLDWPPLPLEYSETFPGFRRGADDPRVSPGFPRRSAAGGPRSVSLLPDRRNESASGGVSHREAAPHQRADSDHSDPRHLSRRGTTRHHPHRGGAQSSAGSWARSGGGGSQREATRLPDHGFR